MWIYPILSSTVDCRFTEIHPNNCIFYQNVRSNLLCTCSRSYLDIQRNTSFLFTIFGPPGRIAIPMSSLETTQPILLTIVKIFYGDKHEKRNVDLLFRIHFRNLELGHKTLCGGPSLFMYITMLCHSNHGELKIPLFQTPVEVQGPNATDLFVFICIVTTYWVYLLGRML